MAIQARNEFANSALLNSNDVACDGSVRSVRRDVVLGHGRGSMGIRCRVGCLVGRPSAADLLVTIRRLVRIGKSLTAHWKGFY